MAELNYAKIQNAFIQDGIKWDVNVPAASHQSDVWERLIRSIRSILVSVLKKQALEDEGLQTVLCEAEAILNDRAFTRVCSDSMILKHSHPIICCCRKTNQFCHQECLINVIFMLGKGGNGYSTWQSCSGKDGFLKTYL